MKTNTKVIIFSAIQESSVGMLMALVSQWKTERVDSCCILMNICLSETGKTLMANSRITGNRWVCIYHQFESNLWVFVDCLGYSPLDQLYQSFSALRIAVQCMYNFIDSNETSLIMAHSHGFCVNKKCNKNCIKHFKHQGSDMNICGLASILSAVVLIKKSFVKQTLIHRRLAPCYSWFSNLVYYGDFLRRVVIIWDLDSRIDLSLINMDINQRKVSQS